MSDLFPKELVEEKPEAVADEREPVQTKYKLDEDRRLQEPLSDKEVETVEMDISDKKPVVEDLEKPFIDEETDVEIKPKKKKRQLSEKQLAALAKAREKSKAKRQALAKARGAEADAKKDEKKKKAEEKRRLLAEKRASELAEIDAFKIVQEKKYSFTKEELNDLLDNTIDRHETKRKKRKEEQKRQQQPMVAQPYPYALGHVAVPQPYPIHQHPNQPPPLSYSQMTGDQIRETRKKKENKKVDDFMNNFFNIN